MQVATAGALLEIVQKSLVSAHDTVDFIAPLALALVCQPASDQVCPLTDAHTVLLACLAWNDLLLRRCRWCCLASHASADCQQL